jgi:exodeoxyribonuclease VII small subunit
MAKSKTDFEKDFKRLEEISENLESGDITLENALKIYEEGVQITKKLLEVLTNAELKISQLKAELNGSMKKINFQTDKGD